ncbi:hypothetical protein A2154_04945 [Candidatus Gottesmanbacteria bacterium RBG_16_43_7]|uniref:Glycosyltransferase RgtA/B/C/D-like domain-containing protein n=1 Tax=Candidatus Gottesmanbacteria bacterium RBG_16_43_7 TaxID=1798373 RepID=A0A1F5ZCL3_9BACT|nr:MAG: hypothetical protein A2154_04945 [Candidatus Gottesmanbacteria bacterium RBG_16_43_7]
MFLLQNRIHKIFIIFIIAINCIFIYQTNHWAQHFSELADRIIQGYLNLVKLPKLYPIDFVTIGSHHYWPLSPFPAILLIPPKLIFGAVFTQIHLLIIFDLLFIYFAYILAAKVLKYGNDAIYFVAVLLFGSIYVAIIYDSSSYYIAHLISSVYMLALIYELITLRRSFIMGLLVAFIFLTRAIGIFAAIPVFGYLFYQKSTARHKLKDILVFLLPIFLCISFLLIYNYLRFGNIFESGYAISYILPLLENYRQQGLFSIVHVSMNLYWYFLSTPILFRDSVGNIVFPYIQFNRWGLSLFIIAPFFLYSLKTWKIKVNIIRSFWITIGIMLICLLFYYGTGWHTFGPRYTADFFPLLYILLVYAFKNKLLTRFHKNFIILSCLFNTYLIYATNFYRG